MLKNTFMHIPGIGNITEQRLWESGIHHWDQFTGNHSIRLSPTKIDTINTCLEQSYQHLKTGNQKALETLLAYNIQDVLSLEHLMVISYNSKINHTPFYRNQLPEPVLPEIPFEVDMETVERIKSENIYAFENSLYY